MPRRKKYDFEVALSFAGEDRKVADKLAGGLRAVGVRIFYDRYEQARLWGRDLYHHLQRVYRDKAEYCVILVSKHYAKRLWARHELRQAQARAFKENHEYILPLRLDDTEIPGLNATVGYLDLRQHRIKAVQSLLLQKLHGVPARRPDAEELSWRGDLVKFRGMDVASFWPKKLARAQRKRTYTLIREFERVRYGSEQQYGPKVSRVPCHDCGAVRGEYHVPGCDMEECPGCREQALCCACILDQE